VSFANRYKGSDIASIDSFWPHGPIFDPRRDIWDEHIKLDGPIIQPMTPVSEVTARVLRLNASERVIERQLRQLVGETSQPRIRCTKPLPGKQVCWSLGLSGSRGCAYSVGLGTAFIPHSLATVNLCGEALFIAKANRELLRREGRQRRALPG